MEMELYAYVGEDELGSGEVGLKQGLTEAGMIPLVAIRRDKIDRPNITMQLHAQARQYGKRIRLVRFVATDDVLIIDPVAGVVTPWAEDCDQFAPDGRSDLCRRCNRPHGP